MPYRIVVFDMDETIGSFGQLGAAWGNRRFNDATFPDFCVFMSRRMECCRPGAVMLLRTLCNARSAGVLDKIVMYTNNNGHASWAQAIAGAFGHLAGQRVFDSVVTGYQPGSGNCRTTHAKTYTDLCRCLNLPPDTQVCFVDDQYHPGMVHENVMYLRVPSVLRT